MNHPRKFIVIAVSVKERKTNWELLFHAEPRNNVVLTQSLHISVATLRQRYVWPVQNTSKSGC
jgi:hypothetical protein